MTTGDTATDAYLSHVSDRLEDCLDRRLVAVWLGGSAATNDFCLGASDLDVVVVVSRSLEETTKTTLVHAVRHQAVPCPAEGLDLLVMTEAEVAHVRRIPHFEVSLATGAEWPELIERGGPYPGVLLDLESLRRQGLAIFGPPPSEIMGDIPQVWIRQELLETIVWHRKHLHDAFHDPYGANAVLNTIRALRYFHSGTLGSKEAGVKWSEGVHAGEDLGRRALAARQHGSPLKRSEVLEFLDRAQKRLKHHDREPVPGPD